MRISLKRLIKGIRFKRPDLLKNKKKRLETDILLLKKIRKFTPLEILFLSAALFACIKAASCFFIACAVYSFINVFTRTIILSKFTGNKGKKEVLVSEDKLYSSCIDGGIVLLLASFALMAACGLLLFTKDNVTDRMIAVIIQSLTVINLFFSVYNLIAVRKYSGMVIGFYRLLNQANLLVVFALFVGVTLRIYGDKDNLTGLTGILLSGCAFCLTGYALWKTLLTREKNRKLYHHIRNNRTIIFTRLSLQKDIIVVFGKVVLSLITLSGFMLVNALYSAGMGIARYLAIYAQNKEQNRQIRSYFEIGAAISSASLCYVAYSYQTFSNPFFRFDMNAALIIALYTFTEFFLIIKDYMKARKAKNLISEEIKLIGLSSTFICLVLTQVAIMSFSNEGDNTFTNRLSGIIFGGMSAFVGVYMMLRSKYLRKRYREEQS
ncbi:hypothetical protein SAMN02745136_00026 [Anaerocolumna jejuensis DSM 15929]|uniref:Uncharacterized protein n=1 Tax=Anaerocolumna jejuensis DSM 15929 TaxID=1121322 RepID=A0A1M6JCJ0_9FIRM|nr:hypothetical protein SAMN02745136_00026 [Anaerocolumna jejuensis DSM 15929]